MELVCPAGNLPSLKAAVDNGANAVVMGFGDDRRGRDSVAPDFDGKRVQEGIRYAHDRGVKVFAAINTFPQPCDWSRWQRLLDHAAGVGVDALSLADIGLMDYVCHRWPDLSLHLSVQGAANNTEAIEFYFHNFAIRRVVLPRGLRLKQVMQVAKSSPVAVEVIGFGSFGVMLEGHCLLSSYVTGRSADTYGTCEQSDTLNSDKKPDRSETGLHDMLSGKTAGLNTLESLPGLQAAGVAAIRVKGAEHSPVFVEQVTRVWRQAIDLCEKNPRDYKAQPGWLAALEKVSQG